MSSKRAKKRFESDVNIINFHNHPSATIKKQRVYLSPRNTHQEIYLEKLADDRTDIIFAVGPAGTGKSMLAVQYGIKLFQDGVVDKIVVTRPAVSADEDLGFLPGTLNEKMAPWIRPLLDVFEEYYSPKEIAKMMEDGVLEIAPFAMMRGRTFKYSYIVADETQGCTPNQMKMLLTRIGEGSKMVVTGDLNQADRGQDNGLREFLELMKARSTHKDSRIDIIEFDTRDIERHPVISEVLSIYNKD